MAHRYRDPYTGKNKRQAYIRMKKGRKKLEKLYETCGDQRFPWPIIWSEYEWISAYNRANPSESAYLVRNYRDKISKKVKKTCSRRIRRKLKDPEYECGNGNSYRKHTEFWWELY